MGSLASLRSEEVTTRGRAVFASPRQSCDGNRCGKCCGCRRWFLEVPQGPPPRQGGDGWWYCHECWPEFWLEDEDGAPGSPPVNHLFSRWCVFREDAFTNLFPKASSLPGMVLDATNPSLVPGGVCALARPGDALSAVDAARIFFEHGFVVLRGALPAMAVQEVLHTCRRVHDAVRKGDPMGLGSRGRGRYSFHTAVGPGQCLHFTSYTRHLVDNPAVLDVLDAIFTMASHVDVEAVQRQRHEVGSATSGSHSCASADGAAHTPEATRGSRNVSASGDGATCTLEEKLFADGHSAAGELYHITGAGGDFCEGWVRDYQPLHSDYGRARPLRGAPWLRNNPEYGDDAPVHVREAPPVISVNFAVQPQHRWNGAMRLISWGEIERYMLEYQDGMADYVWDVEVPPSMAKELKLCPSWLASRTFPLAPGDAVLRDVRVWHGGCPNLSMVPRYMPSVEVSSKAMLEYFKDRHQSPWPKRLLPATLACGLSCRAQRACARVTAAPDDCFVGTGVDDFGWMKPKVYGEAKRNFFAHGVHLSPRQSLAAGLRAVLEAVREAEPHSDGEACLESEQVRWLVARLDRLSAAAPRKRPMPSDTALLPPGADVAAGCEALLRALAGGGDAYIFADEPGIGEAAAPKAAEEAARAAASSSSYLAAGDEALAHISAEAAELAERLLKRLRRRGLSGVPEVPGCLEGSAESARSVRRRIEE